MLIPLLLTGLLVVFAGRMQMQGQNNQKTIPAMAQDTGASLHALQQRFVDLRFGMFIHFNIPTFMNQDRPCPVCRSTPRGSGRQISRRRR
jgi:hypothetical protein